MKKVFIVLSFFGILNALAQSKPECEKLLTDFEFYYNEGFNEKAFLTEEGREKTLNIIQKTIKECPSQNKNIYLSAEDMLLQIIKPMNLGEERQKWTQYLTELFDKQGQYFPETKKENTIKKTVILYNNGVYSAEQAFKSFDELYTSDKQSFSAEALLIYTDLLASKSLTEKNLSSEYIKKIDNLSSGVTAKISNLEKKKETIKNEKEIYKINTDIASLKIALRNLSSGLKVANLTCETWNNIYKDEYQKNKSDTFWLQNALTRLENYKCGNNNEFFVEMAQTYYDLDKNSKSAFYVGNIAQQQKDYKKAAVYFNESAELETNQKEKAKIYYRIADFYRGKDNAQTKLFLGKAIENNPEMIEAYILLSQLYSQAERACFNDDFEYKTRYFLASQTLDKLVKVNPKYKTTTDQLSKGYLEKAPSKDEVKKAKMKGKTLNLGCWINQSVLVP